MFCNSDFSLIRTTPSACPSELRTFCCFLCSVLGMRHANILTTHYRPYRMCDHEGLKMSDYVVNGIAFLLNSAVNFVTSAVFISYCSQILELRHISNELLEITMLIMFVYLTYRLCVLQCNIRVRISQLLCRTASRLWYCMRYSLCGFPRVVFGGDP
jgi:hypothetical protein